MRHRRKRVGDLLDNQVGWEVVLPHDVTKPLDRMHTRQKLHQRSSELGAAQHLAASLTAVKTLNPDIQLRPIGAAERTVAKQLKMFHLAVIVIDPYTNESAWILDVAQRVLENFANASCRVGWVITADEYDAKAFLGPLAERFMTFLDPNRELVAELGLSTIPALVHVDHDFNAAIAEGWNPEEWRTITDNLANVMGWSGLTLPKPGDPVAFPGSPAKG